MRVVRRPISFPTKVRVSIITVVNLRLFLLRWRQILIEGGQLDAKKCLVTDYWDGY